MTTTETPTPTEEEIKTLTPEQVEGLTEALAYVLLGEKIPLDVENSQTGEIIIPANRLITKSHLRKMAKNCWHIEIDPSPIRRRVREVVGEYLVKQGLSL